MSRASQAIKRTLIALFALPAISVDASVPPCDIVRSTLQAYDRAIEMYVADHRHLPTEDRWFEALIQAGTIRSAQFRYDPWGHPYVYTVAGTTYDLRSVGPDGELGTSDDQFKQNDWQWDTCRHTVRSWFHCR